MSCRVLLALLTMHVCLCLATGASAATIDLVAYSFDPLVAEPKIPSELQAHPSSPGELTLGIVQFEGPVTSQMREALVETGVEIIDYLPEYAYLVRGRAPLAPTLDPVDQVRWVGAYHPAFRLSPMIGGAAYRSPDRIDDESYHLRVQTVGDPESVADAADALGGDMLDIVFDGHQHRLILDLPKGEERSLAHHPDVVWIEEIPEYRVWNNTTRWVVQSNVSGATPIWNQGIHGEGQIVAIMDSGLDYGSCWFRDHGNPPPGPNHRKIIDYSTWGGNPYDGCSTGHGTHVSGTLAGDQSYINSGNYNYNGMAYGAKIVLQDIGADDWISCLLGLVSVPSSLYAPFNDAFGNGARAHSNSWGSTSNSYDSMARDVDNFMWGHPDFLIFFAAGNSGPGGSTVGSPGTAKNCVTVGATRQATQQNTVASYSSRGPASDGRLKPTVMAPGGESPTYINSANNTTNQSQTCNVQGSPFQGTSMATPAVAGLALLVRQYFKEGWYPLGEGGTGDLIVSSAALVKAALVNGATDMGGADIPNNNEGWGRMLLDDVLYFDGDDRELRIETDGSLTTGQSVEYDYTVETGEPLEIVLVWTDYPAATGGGTKLVNDLDLLVTGPSGSYRGNVFSGGQSTTGGNHDRRNVEEVVRLNSPNAGNYTIRVTGYNVPQGGSQPFALVSTGAFANWPGNVTVEPPFMSRNGLALYPSRPNPFNPATEIRFASTRDDGASVEVGIYDLTGRRVRSLYSGTLTAGRHRLLWDGKDDAMSPVASGTYFVRLETGDTRLAEKITLLR